MFHNSQAVLAISLEPNPTMFQKTLALNDFYFGMDGFPYPMGNIQMIGKTLGGMYRAEKPLLTALMPGRALTEIGLQSQHLVTRDLYMRTDIALAGCAHQAGTCRFGDDPVSSVLDRDCKAHE